jgi:IS30 family transposase
VEAFAEREEIAILHAQEVGVRDIARRLERAPSTISRELRRNAATRGGKIEYRATTAQWHADQRAKRPKVAKLAANAELHDYVQQRLAGEIARLDGTPVAGPAVRWNGRRHGRRQHRRWAQAWSPEQIANILRRRFPDRPEMHVTPETIYRALYSQARSGLWREISARRQVGRG